MRLPGRASLLYENLSCFESHHACVLCGMEWFKKVSGRKAAPIPEMLAGGMGTSGADVAGGPTVCSSKAFVLLRKSEADVAGGLTVCSSKAFVLLRKSEADELMTCTENMRVEWRGANCRVSAELLS